jgi:hypothetical protein
MGVESRSGWVDEVTVVGGGCVEDYEEGCWWDARSNPSGIGSQLD